MHEKSNKHTVLEHTKGKENKQTNHIIMLWRKTKTLRLGVPFYLDIKCFSSYFLPVYCKRLSKKRDREKQTKQQQAKAKKNNDI